MFPAYTNVKNVSDCSTVFPRSRGLAIGKENGTLRWRFEILFGVCRTV
jgi:hypothetical protein